MKLISTYLRTITCLTVATFIGIGGALAETVREGTVDHRESSERQNETVPATRGEPQNEIVPATRAELDAPSDLVLWRVGQTDLILIWMDNASSEFGVEVERGIPTRERGGVNYHFERIFNSEERVQSRVEGTGMRTDMDDGLEPDTRYCYRLRAYRGETVSDYSEPTCAQTQE